MDWEDDRGHARRVAADPSTAAAEYRLLGPVEVLRDGCLVPLGPPKARALLGHLALHAGEVVPSDRLVDALWGDWPPASAGHALQVYVGGLRSVLDPGRRAGSTDGVLRTRRPGYLLAVARDQVDVHRFEELVARGRADAASGRPDRAATTLREALGLWRGGLMSDLGDVAFVGPAVARLDEQRWAAVEDCVDAELAMGRHADLLGELTALVGEHPLRERLQGQLMLALHRCGRQVDALRVFRDVRQRLADQGLTPSPDLGRLQVALLRHEPDVAAPAATAAVGTTLTTVADPDPDRKPHPDPPPAGASPLNRTVTAVHAAVTAEERPDDDLRAVLARVPERLAACLRVTGGTLVAQGPATVTAAFGLAEVHEDDPERALRAALDAVREVDRHGREIAESFEITAPVARIGVCTGVLPADPQAAGDGAEQAREAELLAAAAEPGTVFVDARTRELVEDQFVWGAVHGAATEARAPRRSSGKIRGLAGRAVHLVGRDGELAVGRAAIDTALAGTGGALWLSGEVGLGKTRLLTELRRHATGARWLQGNCLSYGDGVPHWPIRELVHDWIGLPMQAPELRVRARLRTTLDELLGPGAEATHLGLAGLLDLRVDDEPARPHSPEATARITSAALLAVLTGLAAAQPLIIAVEDVHWADAGSLRLLEAVLTAIEDHAITLIVTHRPERSHPSWRLRERSLRDFAHHAEEIALRPLAVEAGEELLTALAGPWTARAPVGRRLLAAAEGNPFFLEELVRSVGDPGTVHGDTEATVSVPASVEHVLSSRIARLPGATQHVLAAAAVLGRRFSPDDLAPVMALDAVPSEALRQLTTHGLIEQMRGSPGAEYQFRHALTHEAAYRSLWPPRRRELHRRAAQVVAERPRQHPAATAGALAWHWQQAGEDELAMIHHRLAARAAVVVHALDVAAHHFTEGLAAARRLGSGADPSIRNDLLLGLGQVGRLSGDGDPEARLAEALEAAALTDDPAVAWQARYELGYWLGYVRGRQSEARACFELAARTAEQLGESTGQVDALSRISLLLADELDLLGASRQADRALALAEARGDERALGLALDARKLCALFLGELAEFEELLPRLDGILRRHDELWTLQFVRAEAASAAAATGRWSVADARMVEADEINLRCGDRVCRPFVLSTRAAIERDRGAYGAALAAGRAAMDAVGERGWFDPWVRTERGTLLLELHDLPGAVEQLEIATETSMFPAQRVRSLAQLAWAHWRAGSRRQAGIDLQTAEALLATVTAPAERTYLFGADAALACAAVRLDQGEPERAEELLRPVLTAAQACGWCRPAAAGLLLAARCRQVRGDPAAARTLTQRALDVADRAGLPAVAWRARAAMAGLSAPDTAGLLAQARREVVKLASTLPDDDRRTLFAEGAFAEVDALGVRPP